MKAQLTQEAKDALIKEFNRLSTYSAGENNRRIWMPDAISIIESFPTSDECRWIPCSERLPEGKQYDDYLVSDGKDVWIDTFFSYTGGNNWDLHRCNGSFITKWMPIINP